jgi:large subunit ribosomal protein L4e
MVRFNPYAQTVRRAAMLNEESRDNGKAKDAAKDKNFKN